MDYQLYENKTEASKAAALKAAIIIKKAIRSKGSATLVMATGKSQFTLLRTLVKDKSIEWNKVIIFHLDEYLGLAATHPASFRKYLTDRLISKVHPKMVHLINGSAEGKTEVKRLNRLISKVHVDLTFLGLGENGHLAFNDPPANFDTMNPYIIVKLTHENRLQQVKEGWFSKISAVPITAISMSIHQILKSDKIICLVFGKRKSKIFKECFDTKISNLCPASILRKHKYVWLYMDRQVLGAKSAL